MVADMATVLGGAGLSLGLVYLLRMMFHRKISITGKVVVITGASSGLGEACAHVFHAAGAHIILCARRVHELERVKRDLMKQKQASSLPEPCIVQLDLADLASIPHKVQDILKCFGRLDILINNGGVSFRGEAINTDIDVDIRLMTVNYFGTVALTKLVLPHMINQKSGHIMCVSSVQGRIAIPFRTAYAASKHALQAFCDGLRAEVAHHGVQVSIVSPAYINTNLSLNALTADGSKYAVMDHTTASGMSPDFVAQCILQAVTCRRQEVVLAPLAHHLAMYLRTLAPSLYFIIMKLRATKERGSLKKTHKSTSPK